MSQSLNILGGFRVPISSFTGVTLAGFFAVAFPMAFALVDLNKLEMKGSNQV
jgi:hypothetical protein